MPNRKDRRKTRKKRKDQGEQTFEINRFAEQSARRREYIAATGRLDLLGIKAEPHYHIMYNATPFMGEGYETPTMGYRAMAAIMDHMKEDQYQVYEEGHVLLLGVEIRDRTGKHDIMMQLGECYQPCSNVRKLEVVNNAIQQMVEASAPRNFTVRPRGARYDPNPRAKR